MKHDVVEMAIADLEKYNNNLYNILNSLQDEKGNAVDVYVEVEIDLHTDYFGGSFRKKALGMTGVWSIYYDNYIGVGSSYGENSVVTVLDSDLIDPGKTLSHEGGHLIYEVPNQTEHRNWIGKYADPKKGGHDKGNKSGIEADKQEEIYKNNRKLQQK